jgi:Zn-finger nucleic acid-binding protein
MWFEPGVHSRFDEPTEAAGQTLIELTGSAMVGVDLGQRRRCPTCPGSVMMRHFFSAKRDVTVDECPTCAGIWLDAGKLQTIRSEFESGEARRRAAHVRLEEALVDDRMALMRREIQDQLPYDTSRSRMASSLLVAVYLVAAFKLGGAVSGWRMLGVCVVPWACVCFPEAMGATINPIIGMAKESTRSAVWLLGWLALLLPLIGLTILLLEGVRTSPFTP